MVVIPSFGRFWVQGSKVWGFAFGFDPTSRVLQLRLLNLNLLR